ncbi:MAG: tryptophan--tRNA ligase [Candidatus Omnitrophota bacterium]|jgi:tryptophanyl-tRNA synthetase
MKKRILSGIRPTGKLHLGHLIGALSNWVKMQETYHCFYMVADWHALMSEYEDPKDLARNSIEVARDIIAAGVDPERSVLFVQSHVPEHLELAMVFSTLTPLPWLERCPTYKEQLRDITGRDLTTYGFLGYPVLQAADIAVYKANAVPVGVDQLPHLELTREIIRKFKLLYKADIFPEPEPLLTSTPKLLGLDNRKMSKSLDNFISLSDEPDIILKRVSKMITDPERIKLTDKGHPSICTVFSYYQTFTDAAKREEVRNWCEGALVGCTECKKRLANVIAERLEPIQKKRKELTDSKVEAILKDGALKAREAASKTMHEVKKLINLAV